MKNIYNIVFLIFNILFFSNFFAHDDIKKTIKKKEFTLTPRKNLEYFQEQLFELLYDKINKEHLSKYKISDFISRKSNTLNFFEAAGLLLFSFTDIKYNKHIVWALERLYILSGDSKLSELLLWNLANEYEKHEKFKVAAELYNQFKKIFPGSSFYWLARYKEITVSYKYSQQEYHDISDNEKIIQLIREYIIDSEILNEFFFKDILQILHDLSFKMIKKTVNIGLHYIKKYSYTHNNYTILSSWQRLLSTLNDINYFLEIYIPEYEKNKKYQIYESTMGEIKKNLELFFDLHSIEIPQGFEYEKLQEDIICYIEKNKMSLLKDIKNTYTKINYAIESYYELA